MVCEASRCFCTNPFLFLLPHFVLPTPSCLLYICFYLISRESIVTDLNNIKTIFFFFFFISCASKLRKPSWKRCLRKKHLLCTRLLHICIIIATFRLECEDDNEYEFSVLNKRLGFGGRKFSKSACSELKTRNCSRPRTQLWRSVHLSLQLCF